MSDHWNSYLQGHFPHASKLSTSSWVRRTWLKDLWPQYKNLAQGSALMSGVRAWGYWATRTAIASHSKCHLGRDITTVKTLARSHPVGAAVAWIKVTGGVLFLPATIMVAVISRQAVRVLFPRCPADANNQQVCVWSAVAANVVSWNNS